MNSSSSIKIVLSVLCLLFVLSNATLQLVIKKELPNPMKYGTLLWAFPSADRTSFYAGFQNSVIAELKSSDFSEIRKTTIKYYFGFDGYGHLFATLQSNDSSTLYIGASLNRDQGAIVKFDLQSFEVTNMVPQPCKISLVNAWWQDNGYAAFSDRNGAVFVFDVTTGATPQLIGGYQTGVGSRGDSVLSATNSDFVYLTTMGLGWGKLYKLDPNNYYAQLNVQGVCEGSDMSGPNDFYIINSWIYAKCSIWGTANGYTQRLAVNNLFPDSRWYYSKSNSTLFSFYAADTTQTAVFITGSGDLIEYNPEDFSVVSSLQVFRAWNYQPVPSAFMVDQKTWIIPMTSVSGALSINNVIKVTLT